jgi:5-methylcytosine-specific restriction enzyme subunit McrC
VELSDIRLTTYEDSPPTALGREDFAFLQGVLFNRLRITRVAADDVFVLNPKQYVGAVRLPSGRTVRSWPRIDSRNFLYMLAVANSLPDIALLPAAEFDRFEHLLELVTIYFADLLESRIERGLYRAYVELDENLPVVRGRIQIAQDIQRNVVTRSRVFCRFGEYSWDVPENQILRYVTRLLAGWPFESEVQGRLQQLDGRLEGVSCLPHTPEDVDRISYNRLNISYQPLHRLARLFLEEMSLSEAAGSHELPSFLLDMNALFERFVGTIFEERFPADIGRVELQVRTNLGWRSGAFGSLRWGEIRPDVTVRSRNRVLAVLDTKFKRARSDVVNNPDVFQVLSYCVAMDTDRGALVYPKTEIAETDEIKIANSDIEIRRFALDLTVPPRELRAEVESLVDETADWLGETLAGSVGIA